jgi:hypothetical protein
MTPNDERARHLDAYRRAIAPPADRRARNLDVVLQRIADDETVSLDRDRAPSSRSIVPTAIATSFAIAAAALLVLWGGARGVRALRDAARAPVHEAPATSDRAPIEGTARATEPRSPGEARPPQPEPRTAAERSAGDAPPLAPPGRAAATIGREAAATHVPSAEDRLRRELALVRAARVALQAGDFAEVWRLTQAHATDHPHGALAHERDAWRSLAACRLGREDAGGIFAAFVKDHDGSPYAARVRDACEGS